MVSKNKLCVSLRPPFAVLNPSEGSRVLVSPKLANEVVLKSVTIFLPQIIIPRSPLKLISIRPTRQIRTRNDLMGFCLICTTVQRGQNVEKDKLPEAQLRLKVKKSESDFRTAINSKK